MTFLVPLFGNFLKIFDFWKLACGVSIPAKLALLSPNMGSFHTRLDQKNAKMEVTSSDFFQIWHICCPIWEDENSKFCINFSKKNKILDFWHFWYPFLGIFWKFLIFENWHVGYQFQLNWPLWVRIWSYFWKKIKIVDFRHFLPPK